MGSSVRKPFFLFALVMVLDLGMCFSSFCILKLFGCRALSAIGKLSTSEGFGLFNFSWELKRFSKAFTSRPRQRVKNKGREKFSLLSPRFRCILQAKLPNFGVVWLRNSVFFLLSIASYRPNPQGNGGFGYFERKISLYW